jgi:hypothetical protein
MRVFAVGLLVLALFGLWRSIAMFRRVVGNRPLAPATISMRSRTRTLIKRSVITVIVWAAVTGLVSLFRIDLALWAGAAVIAAGFVWIVKSADPLKIDMADLDREFMELLADEG